MRKRFLLTMLLFIALMLTSCEVDSTPKVSKYASELEEMMLRMYTDKYDYSLKYYLDDTSSVELISDTRLAFDGNKKILIMVSNDGDVAYIFEDYFYSNGEARDAPWSNTSRYGSITDEMIPIFSYPGVKFANSTSSTEIKYIVTVPPSVYEEFVDYDLTCYQVNISMTITFTIDGFLKSYVQVKNNFDTTANKLMGVIRKVQVANAVGDEIDLVIPEPIMMAIQDYIDSKNIEGE